jgi:hypothetical protein
MKAILCDRCRCELTGENGAWYDGCGNCTNCGDDLCADCAQGFDADGYCKLCHEEAAHGKHVDDTSSVTPEIQLARMRAHYNALSLLVSETITMVKDLEQEKLRAVPHALGILQEYLESSYNEERKLPW